MTQTTRTVNEIIQNAFFMIGEFDEEEPIDGNSFQRGFELLNLLVDSFSGSDMYIPITKEINFPLVSGKSQYIISNVPSITPDVVSNRMASVSYCNILYNNFLYPVQRFTRSQLYLNVRANEQLGLPRVFEFIKSEQFTQLNFYPTPNLSDIYICKVQGKFYIDKFEKFEPITNIPLNLQRFFQYALARELAQFFPSSNFSATAEAEYQKMLGMFIASNDVDLMARTSNLLSHPFLSYFGQWTNFPVV